MTAFRQLEPTRVWVELTAMALHARCGFHGVDVPLEREGDGTLRPESRSRVVEELRRITADKPWLSPLHIYCSLGSRGVILRSISLPASSASELPKLLQLQIEAEFPLPPDQLAWGWLPLSRGENGGQELLVAAVKSEVLQACEALFAPLGATLSYSLAALDRLENLPNPSAGSVLYWNGHSAEWTLCDGNGQPAIRCLTGDSHRIRNAWPTLEGASYDVTGPEAPVSQWLALQTETSVNPAPVRKLEIPSGPGNTAATVGLSRAFAEHPNRPRMTLRFNPTEIPKASLTNLPWRSLGLSVALLAAVLIVPSLEALLVRPRLARQLARLKAGEPQLEVIDRELGFLRYLNQNQGPYLEALYLIAQAAPPGCHIDTIHMNRRGEVTLTGFLQNLNQVGDFRLKLIDSGFFSSVVVEDQTPTPDRQRINFRVTAQWKAAGDREGLQIGPTLTNSPAGGVTHPSGDQKPRSPSHS